MELKCVGKKDSVDHYLSLGVPIFMKYVPFLWNMLVYVSELEHLLFVLLLLWGIFMTVTCQYETLSLLFLLVPKSIWVRIWKTRHVLQHKENLTESSFTSLSFSLASGLKSGTIDLPCWRYLIGKPLSTQMYGWETQWGHKSALACL